MKDVANVSHTWLHALQRLREMDISIVEEDNGKKDYSNIQGGDVVIFPAFGATAQASLAAVIEKQQHPSGHPASW
jgi:4-hydroxy-3-methylbut-2-enyl diphosphate reductase IspH